MTRITALAHDPHAPGERGDLAHSGTAFFLAAVPVGTQMLLVRMFADPSLLAADERAHLIRELQDAVRRHADIADLRVLLGMAFCVDLKPQAALDELSEAVKIDPHSFIAHLKLGELWMRLRVCDKAEHYTKRAARLAQSPAQSQLARRQAASIRTMVREGIERGAYWGPSGWLARLRRLRTRIRGRDGALAAVDIG